MAIPPATQAGAIQLISEIPKYVTIEEHKELLTSTPADFESMPPALRCLSEDVSVSFTPAIESFPSEPPTKGNIYVIDSALSFMSASGKGFQIPYPAITLHAISRTEGGPSIYCQLDDNFATQSADDGAEEDEAGEMRELAIFPAKVGDVESIFEALSFCAALHPDPADEDAMDDDGDDAFISNEGDFDEQELSEAGRVALEYLESIIDDPYEDAKHGDDEAEGEDRKV